MPLWPIIISWIWLTPLPSLPSPLTQWAGRQSVSIWRLFTLCSLRTCRHEGADPHCRLQDIFQDHLITFPRCPSRVFSVKPNLWQLCSCILSSYRCILERATCLQYRTATSAFAHFIKHVLFGLTLKWCYTSRPKGMAFVRQNVWV